MQDDWMSEPFEIFIFIGRKYPEAAKVGTTLLRETSDGMATRAQLYDLLDGEMTVEAIDKGLVDLGPLVTVRKTDDPAIGSICILHKGGLITPTDLKNREPAVRDWMTKYASICRNGQIQKKSGKVSMPKPKRSRPSSTPK